MPVLTLSQEWPAAKNVSSRRERWNRNKRQNKRKNSLNQLPSAGETKNLVWTRRNETRLGNAGCAASDETDL